MDFAYNPHRWIPESYNDVNLDSNIVDSYKFTIYSDLIKNQVLILNSSACIEKSVSISDILLKTQMIESGWKVGVVFPDFLADAKGKLFVSKFNKNDISNRFNCFDIRESKSSLILFSVSSLICEIRVNPNLDNIVNPFSIIYFDTFPLSGLKGEFLLSLLATIVKTRGDKSNKKFRLIIGTTCNDQVEELHIFFKNFLGDNVKILSIGNINPRNLIVKHLSHVSTKLFEKVLDVVDEISRSGRQGNILIIAPSMEFCEKYYSALKTRNNTLLDIVYKDGISGDSEVKKNVYFTTSIHLINNSYMNITHVIDLGLCVLNEYDYLNNVYYCDPVKITEEESDMRASVCKDFGNVYRIYSPGSYSHNNKSHFQNYQEILLDLLSFRITTLKGFPFYRPTSITKLGGILSNAYHMKIISDFGELTTDLGEKIKYFHMLPLGYAKFLVSSVEYGCAEEAIKIITLASLNMKFFFGQSRTRQGDLVSLANFWKIFVKIQKPELQNVVHFAKKYKNLLKQYCESLYGKLKSNRDENSLVKAIVSGFSLNSAVFNIQQQCYIHVITGKKLYVHPNSVLTELEIVSHVHYVVYGSLEQHDNKIMMKNITVVDDPNIIIESAPTLYKSFIGVNTTSKKIQSNYM